MTGVVEPIGKFNRGNRCVMYADPVTQIRDSQQKFSNVHVAFVHRSVDTQVGVLFGWGLRRLVTPR